MNAPAGPVFAEPIEVRFDNGNRALVWEEHGEDPDGLSAWLGLDGGGPGCGAILVSGGADGLEGAPQARAAAMLAPAVSAAAQVTGAAVLDGGTASGVMAITGAARAQDPGAMPVLAGVAPAGLVGYPGGPAAGRVQLDQNHSHFVLADSAEWGGETRLLIAMAAAAGHGRVVVVLAGGGGVAKAEILASVRRGWPVFVIGETGGLADSLEHLWSLHRAPPLRRAARILPARYQHREPAPLSAIADPDLREIISDGDVRIVTETEPGLLARQVAWELQDEAVLKSAWQDFATYDHAAVRLRRAFTRLQASILLLGVIATLLALIHAETGGAALRWVVVVLPVVATVLIALAGRRAVGQRWVMVRAAAESIKASIFRYRTAPAGPGDGGAAGASPEDEHAARQLQLAAELEAIETRLMQTQASSGPLTPYTGPLPPEMYGAGYDDDGLSAVDAERYLSLRISDQLVYYHSRIRSLDRGRNALQMLAVAAGATGAVLAAAGREVWIGLTSGIAAAALAYLGYLQIDNTVVTFNQAAATLTGLEREWRARSPAQRSAAALADLVTRAEAALTAERAGWVQQMSDTLETLQNQQAEAGNRLLAAHPRRATPAPAPVPAPAPAADPAEHVAEA